MWDALKSPHYFHAYSSASFGEGKDRHFISLHSYTGIAFKEMVFFDDMKDNIVAAQKMGITSVLMMKDGLTIAAFVRGILEWREKQG